MSQSHLSSQNYANATAGTKTEADLKAVLSGDVDGCREAVLQIQTDLAAFGDRLPNHHATALDALESSLS